MLKLPFHLRALRYFEKRMICNLRCISNILITGSREYEHYLHRTRRRSTCFSPSHSKLNSLRWLLRASLTRLLQIVMQAVSIWAASVVVLDLLDMKGNSKELMQSTLTALIGIGEPGCLPAQTFFQRHAPDRAPSFRGLCKTAVRGRFARSMH